MRNVAPVLVAICLCACAASAAHATEPFTKVGFYGAQWLKFPIGVRNIGMGATGASDISGFASGYFNPASVAWSNVTTIGGSYENFDISDLGLSLSRFQATSPLPFHPDSTAGAWHFAGSVAYTRFDYNQTVERTIFLPEGTGHTFDPDSWMLSTLATSRWDHGVFSLAAGATAKYIDETLGAGDETTWAFDLGLITSVSVPVGSGVVRPRLGYSALNLDTGGNYDGREYSIENELRYGVGFDLEAPRVIVWHQAVPVLSAAVDYDLIDRETSPDPNYAAGFEVSLVRLLHVRYGVLDNDYKNYGAGVGWDFGNVLFRIDYAHSRPEDAFFREFINFERDTVGALVGVRW